MSRHDLPRLQRPAASVEAPRPFAKILQPALQSPRGDAQQARAVEGRATRKFSITSRVWRHAGWGGSANAQDSPMSCFTPFHSKSAKWRISDAIHDPCKWISKAEEELFAKLMGKRRYEDFIPARKLALEPCRDVA
jgi:hypothetical protein